MLFPILRPTYSSGKYCVGYSANDNLSGRRKDSNTERLRTVEHQKWIDFFLLISSVLGAEFRIVNFFFNSQNLPVKIGSCHSAWAILGVVI